MLKEEDIAAIVGMYFVDRLTINQISQATGRHHTAIKRVIGVSDAPQKGAAEAASRQRATNSFQKLSPHREYIEKLLESNDRITTPRILEKLADRSLHVSVYQLYRFLRRENLRKKPQRRASFMKVKTAPGEQAQVDWASCGKLKVAGGQRPLSLFVMILGYSRKVFARFYCDQTMASFLSAHLQAFAFFEGLPEVVIYDNLKSAVVSRVGNLIQYNPNLLRFAAQHRFKIDACNPRSGWEKGKVERAIRTIRDGFLAARDKDDLQRLNDELSAWITGVLNQRAWPQDKTRKVEDVWIDEERQRLRSLRQSTPPVEIKIAVRVGKTPYVTFDTNHYSVPVKCVHKEVILWVSEDSVRVFSDNAEVCCHERSYAKGKDIEAAEHLAEMLADRKAAREQIRRRIIYQNLKNAESFFKSLHAQGVNLAVAHKKIYELSSRHPLATIDAKMRELLDEELVSVAGLSQLLDNEDVCQSELLDLSRYPSLDRQMIYQRDLSSYQKLGAIFSKEDKKNGY